MTGMAMGGNIVIPVQSVRAVVRWSSRSTRSASRPFTDVPNAYCTVQKLDNGEVLARYDLTDTQPSTALLMAELRRGEQPAAWRMRAIGEFHDFRTVKKLVPAAPRQVRLGGQPAT